jgi:hypothetical protein
MRDREPQWVTGISRYRRGLLIQLPLCKASDVVPLDIGKQQQNIVKFKP